MKVVLARTPREAELLALERELPPRSRDVVLVATDSRSGLSRLLGLMLRRDDVIESDDAHRGRFYDEAMRTLEPAFYDDRDTS